MYARTFLTYALGSYLLAALLNFGFVLIVGATWQAGLGGTMIFGTILLGLVLRDREKKEGDVDG